MQYNVYMGAGRVQIQIKIQGAELSWKGLRRMKEFIKEWESTWVTETDFYGRGGGVEPPPPQ